MNFVERIVRFPKHYLDGKKFHNEQKEIELMSLQELDREALFILHSKTKVDTLDSRTKDILRTYFSYGLKTDHDLNSLVSMALYFESEKVREEIFDLYFEQNDAPIEFLDKQPMNFISFNPTSKVRRERALNHAKYAINKFTSKVTRPFREDKTKKEEGLSLEMQGFLGLDTYKKNPFEISISRKEEESFNKKNRAIENHVQALLYKKCMDVMDLENFISHTNYETILKIIEILPEDKRKEFAVRYVNTKKFKDGYGFNQQILEAIIPELPREELIQVYMRRDSERFPWLKAEDITDDELLTYHINSKGNIPHGFSDRFEELLEKQPFEKRIEILSSIDDPRDFYVNPLCRNITYEQLKQILENNDINSKVKDEAMSTAIYYLSKDERLELFKALPFEEQRKFFRSFTYARGFSDEDSTSEFIEEIKDEDFKKLYGILHRKEKITVSEFISLSNAVNYSFEYSKEFLLAFSDAELREIYEKTNDENLRNDLIRLNRKKDTMPLFRKRLPPEEVTRNEEYNKTVPDSVIVDKDNILHLLKTAKTARTYYSLLSRPEFKDFDFKTVLQCYYDFESRTESLEEDEYSKVKSIREDFISKLRYSADFLELLELTRDGILDKKTFILNYSNNADSRIFKREDIYAYINVISGVEDIELKQAMLKSVNEAYVREDYLLQGRRGSEEENRDKISKIYKDKIMSSQTSIEDKYLFFGELVNNYYYMLIRTDDKAEHSKLTAELTDMFKMINQESGRTEYDKIFDFSPEYRFSEFAREERMNYSKYYNISECLPYLNTDKVYELMQKLYQANTGIQEKVNKKFLNDKIIDTVDYEIIEYLSRYGKSFEDNPYNPKELTDDKINLFINAYNRLKMIKTYPEEKAINLITVITDLSDEEIEQTNFEDTNNLDLLVLASLRPEIAKELARIKPKDGTNRFEIYKEQIKENARKEIKSPFSNKRMVLNAIGKRFFNFSYQDMRLLKKKYDADFKTIFESYQEKAKNQELTEEEELELKSLTIFRNISELMEIKDKNALIRVFEELDKADEYENCNFAAMSVIEETIKRIYSRDLQKNSYKPYEADKVDSIDGIDVYSPKEFKMFVHVIAAFGEFKLVDWDKPELSSRDVWNNTRDKQNHILCTSYVGNDQMCYARWDPDIIKKTNPQKGNDTVIFGFGNIDNTEIIMASQSDIGSRTTDFSSEQSYHLSRFRLAEKIIRKCRHGHNEVDLERRQRNNRERNIEPEFIVCFDEINEASKKVAKDFNIPIVLVDKREVAKQQSEKINSLISEFKQTKRPELLEPIINLYQCALAGFNVGKRDNAIREEFFNPEKMNQEVRNMISIIEGERKLGNTQNANACYWALYEAFEEEIEICKEEYVDPEEYSKNKFHIREFRYELKQAIKKNKIPKITPKLRGEESVMYQAISNERRAEKDGREEE